MTPKARPRGYAAVLRPSGPRLAMRANNGWMPVVAALGKPLAWAAARGPVPACGAAMAHALATLASHAATGGADPRSLPHASRRRAMEAMGCVATGFVRTCPLQPAQCDALWASARWHAAWALLSMPKATSDSASAGTAASPSQLVAQAWAAAQRDELSPGLVSAWLACAALAAHAQQSREADQRQQQQQQQQHDQAPAAKAAAGARAPVLPSVDAPLLTKPDHLDCRLADLRPCNPDVCPGADPAEHERAHDTHLVRSMLQQQAPPEAHSGLVVLGQAHEPRLAASFLF